MGWFKLTTPERTSMNTIRKISFLLAIIVLTVSCQYKGNSSEAETADHNTEQQNQGPINFSEGVKEIQEWFDYVTPLAASYKPVTIYTGEEFDQLIKSEPEKITALFLDFRINREKAKLVDIRRIRALTNLEYFETLGFEKLPAEIYSLTKLRVIHTDGDFNAIAAISNLKGLEELSMNWTHNVLPASIKKLSKLKTLRLIGTPQQYHSDIFDLPNLESLWINFDDTTQLSGISKLKKLKCLMANKVTKEVGELTQLTGLNIDGGTQREFPMELGKLQSLVAFSIHANVSITEAPNFVSQLKSLEYIMFRNCDYLTVIPDSYNHVSSLKRFDIHYNGIMEMPANLGTIRRVINLQTY